MSDLANDYGRLILAALCLAAALLCFNSASRFARSAWGWTALAAIVRVAGAVLLYGVADVAVSSDAVLFYEPWARAILAGGTVYREVATQFSPGFPLLLGGLFGLWPSPFVFVAFFLCCDVLACWLWLRVGRRFAVPASRLGPLLALNPAMVPLAVIGQDECLVLALAGLLVLALVHDRWRLAATWTVLGLVFTKMLFVLYAVPATKGFVQRRSPALIVAGSLLAVLAATVLAGGDPLTPFRLSGADGLVYTEGNLFYLATWLGPWAHDAKRLFDFLLLIGLLAAAIRIVRQPPSITCLPVDMSLLLLLWTLLARMSWYEVLLLPCLAIVVLQARPVRPAVALYVLFAAAVAQMPRLWWRMVEFGDLAVDPGEDAGAVAAFGAVQLCFVAMKVALLLWVLRQRGKIPPGR